MSESQHHSIEHIGTLSVIEQVPIGLLKNKLLDLGLNRDEYKRSDCP